MGCNQAQESPPYTPPKNVVFDELSLASAIENNDPEQARSCIARGIDPNTPIEEGLPPLQLAAFAGHLEVGQALIDLGAHVDGSKNPQDAVGRRPLHVAVSRGRLEFVKLLLDNKANPNVSDRLQQTPLDLAVGHAASLGHLRALNRTEAAQAKRNEELAKNRAIRELLRGRGGKTTAEIEREKMDAEIQTHKDKSLLDRSRQSLEQSKIKSGRTKRPPASSLPKSEDQPVDAAH